MISKWLILTLCLGIAGCASGPIPITLSGYGATATVVIPQQQPKTVPVMLAPPIMTQPALLVPPGTVTSPTAVAVNQAGLAQTVQVLPAPVSIPMLVVPRK